MRPEQQLADSLFQRATQRCPHVNRDAKNRLYCGKDLQDTVISDQRRLVCDTASLQSYCLTETRYTSCIFFNGTPVE